MFEVIWGIYAKPGSSYARGTNPFGRDLMGFVWSDSGAAAVAKYAAREGLDAAQLEY